MRSLRLLLLLTGGLLAVAPSAAQFTDDFSDGDFTQDPAWTGTISRWVVDTLGTSPALRSAGAARSDTLFLTTPSAVSRGTWSFTFAHTGVNLSIFNGARLFLMADAEDLRGPVHGYYVQLGASNGDEVRLYRLDGAPEASGNRILLGQSRELLLAGDDNTLAITVTRSAEHAWSVAVDGETVFTARDATYTESRFFGVWVKHTQAAARAFFLDDFAVTGLAAPADSIPPSLVGASALDANHVEAVFSEPVNGCFQERFDLSPGIGTPAALEACLPGSATYTMTLPRPLVNGLLYTLTVRAIEDLAGNVLDEGAASFTFFADEAPSPDPGDVVINEIFYEPPEANLEFVELFNRTDHAFDLSRLTFSDDRLQPVPISEAPVLLPPGGFAVLVRDAAAFEHVFPGRAVVAPPSWPALNDAGDGVVLKAGEGVIDAVFYEPSWGGENVSLERRDPAGPSQSRFNFGASVAPGGATPGAVNSLFAPDRLPPRLLFAEQTDTLTLDVIVDEPVDAASLQADAFSLDTGQQPIRITARDEGTRLTFHFDAPVGGSRLTAKGLRDLTGNEAGSETVDVAVLARPGDLVINEILFDPRADRYDERPDQPEYVELFNRSGRLLTLSRHAWSDAPDEHGHADTLLFGGERSGLPPLSYAVVHARPEAGRSALHEAFPEVTFGNALLLPVTRASLGLRNDGDLIRLLRPDGVPLDSVSYDPAWHHPALDDAGGVALERLDPGDDPNDPTNWTSSVDPSGGTPGRSNSVGLPDPAPQAAPLVIEPAVFSPDRDGLDDVAVIRYRLDQHVSLVRVRIYDAYGRPVRVLEEAFLAGRAGQLTWDGLDDAGRGLRVGLYVILFEAVDAAGGITVSHKRPVVLARRID